jgi:superfamily I DNA and RNA helicase
MTKDELFYYMNNTSKTFRKEIHNLEKSLENAQMKTKVIEFNSLSFEEREIIHYYITQSKIQEIDFICNKYNHDISPRLKSSLMKRREVLESFLHENYEELKNEKV